MNDLRDKARRAFYAIKRNIKLDIPIKSQKSWYKIVDAVIEPTALYGCEAWGPLTNQDLMKWDNIKSNLYMQNSANLSLEFKEKHKIMRAE